MTSILHADTLSGTNSVDPVKVSKDRWNAEHVLTGMNQPAFQAYRSVATTAITEAVNNVIDCDTEVYDYGGCYDTSTARFVPNVAGIYLVSYHVTIAISTTGNIAWASPLLLKNGILYHRGGMFHGNAGTVYGSHGVAPVQMNGTTDYLQIGSLFTTIGGVSAVVVRGGSAPGYTAWQAHLIRG